MAGLCNRVAVQDGYCPTEFTPGGGAEGEGVAKLIFPLALFRPKLSL